MKTVSQLIKELQRMEDAYGDKPIEVECPNGLLVSPTIKTNKINRLDIFNNSSKNIKSLVLTWQG